MKTFDDIRSAAELLETAGAAMESDGCQEETEHELGILAKGALDWATDQSTPMAKRFVSLLARYDSQLKRLSSHGRRRSPVGSK